MGEPRGSDGCRTSLTMQRSCCNADDSGKSFTAITLCKPSLSWTLISVAARLCQTLGYHRLSGANAAKDPDAARKVVMFWLVYIMDRNTSLRLGRAPILQEFDISTAPLDSSTQYSNFSPGLIQLFQYWTTVANVQGRISTQLYSPAGLGESPEERARLIDSLSLDLQEAWGRREKVCGCRVYMCCLTDQHRRMTRLSKSSRVLLPTASHHDAS